MIKECLECGALFEVVENFQPCPRCGEKEELERFKYKKFSQEQVYEEIEHLENILIRIDKRGVRRL